jgi:hypothetical protein
MEAAAGGHAAIEVVRQEGAVAVEPAAGFQEGEEEEA